MFLERLMSEFGPNLIDVIREVKNAAGQTSFVAEIAALEARHVNLTLVDVARDWFGHGHLKGIGNGMYAVLKAAAKIADARAYLHAADAKLVMVADDFDDENSRYLGTAELTQTQLTARAVARMLDSDMAAITPRWVLRAIAGHVNTDPRNTPHIEGTIIALKLAEQALESALDFDADEISPADETPYAAWCIVRELVSMLDCLTIQFDQDAAMDAILGGRGALAVRQHLHEMFG